MIVAGLGSDDVVVGADVVQLSPTPSMPHDDSDSERPSPMDESEPPDDGHDGHGSVTATPLCLQLFDNHRLTEFVQDFLKRCNRRRMNKAQRREMWSLMSDWNLFDPTEMQSFDTLDRKVRDALPTPTVHWKVKDLDSGRIYSGKGTKFPEKRFKNKRKYETLCIWTRVKLRELIRFHAAQHQDASYVVDGQIKFNKVHFSFTYDGIPNGKSSPDNLHVMGIQFRGCRQIYIPCVRVARRKEVKNLSKFLDHFIQECITLGVHVDFFLADAPMRSFLKCLKGHAGRYSCEYCEAPGECVLKKICYPTSMMNQKKRSHQQWVEHVEDLEKQQEEGSTNINVKGITGRSPLLKIYNFDMIKKAPSDPLHRDWLGICKSTLWRHCVGLSKTGNLTASGKRITDQVSEVYRKLSLPREFSHRSRPIDYPNFKGHEWKSLAVSCFPTICEVVEKEVDYEAAHVWLLFIFLVLVYNGPEWALKKLGEGYLMSLHELMYEQFEESFGRSACTFNWHAFYHMPDIRKCGRSTQMSTEPYESAYGEVQAAYKSGTRNIGLQIVSNMLIKRINHTSGTGCQNRLIVEPRTSDVRYNDSIVLDEMYNYYRIVKVEGDLMAAQKIETTEWSSPIDENVPMSLAGVFKYVSTREEEVLLRRQDVHGKGIITENNIVIPFYRDLLFS